MKNNYEEILDRINLITQASSNIEKGKIENIKKEVLIYRELVLKALRALSEVNLPVIKNKQIDVLELQKNKYLEYFKLKKACQNFKESLGINKIIYEIDNPKTLEGFNSNLKKIIEILLNIEIKVNEESFTYTPYVTNYMKEFFKEYNKEDFNKNMKSSFDGIYWENNEILSDISLNIKVILNQNEKSIKEKSNIKLTNFIKEKSIDESTAIEKLDKIKFELEELKRIEPVNIKELFLLKGENPEDYTKESANIVEARRKFITDEAFNNLGADKKEIFFENIYDLYNNIIEFENVHKFSFMLDSLKTIFLQKDSIKGVYQNKLKTIEKQEKEKEKLLAVCNRMLNEHSKILTKKTSILSSEKSKIAKIEKLDFEIKKNGSELTKKIEEIKAEQKTLNKAFFEETVSLNLNENSSIYDALNLYNNNYIELISILKTNKMENELDNFYDFINSPYIIISKSIDFLKYNELDKIIEEKYNLLQCTIELNINSKDYQEKRDSIVTLSKYRNILKSKINLNSVKDYLNFIKEA
ncbi:MAG: hypothetical protein RR832_01225 [Bacilli bacterium]